MSPLSCVAFGCPERWVTATTLEGREGVCVSLGPTALVGGDRGVAERPSRPEGQHSGSRIPPEGNCRWVFLT